MSAGRAPDVVVIGGGAAGLMCAATAGRRGRRVLVLEGSNRVGKKILMSGGGRCNFTNLGTTPEHFISANPHFARSALARYTQFDFIDLVERHGIAYHEKTKGQLFCDDSSKRIVAMLLAECEAAGVDIETGAGVRRVEAVGTRFCVQAARGPVEAESVVIATGGLSIPKMGATGFGYDVARAFGLDVLETRAGLVPFVFDGDFGDTCRRLAGVSTPAVVGCETTSTGQSIAFEEGLLFSHRGLTGPAVLQLSSYWRPGMDVVVNFVPGCDLGARLRDHKRERPKLRLRAVLASILPRALADEFASRVAAGRDDLRLAEWPDAALDAVADTLTASRVRPSGTEGYRTAEVTLGGVDTEGLSSKTMAAKRVPGLYFVGEVVDVTGHLGGYNFQWAWSSGVAAGEVV